MRDAIVTRIGEARKREARNGKAGCEEERGWMANDENGGREMEKEEDHMCSDIEQGRRGLGSVI